MHRRSLIILIFAATALFAQALFADDSARLLTVDHYVRVTSTVPAMSAQLAQIYVREVVQPSTVLRGGPGADKVVLFIHGAGTPAEVAFDVPYQDYSWMQFLAREGFDVFSMDMTGYGRSSRPAPMNDPCNLSKEQRAVFAASPCKSAVTGPITTIATDWQDIDSVVDHLRAMRHVEKVNLIGWSQGGPRSGGYAAQHPEKVARLVVLAPAYNRNMPREAPQTLGAGTSFNTQSHQDFVAGWDRQVGCPDQYTQAASDVVWKEMLASDPIGATWGNGVRRAPSVPSWGWNQEVVSKMQTPYLMISGAHDKQVPPERVRDLYADIGSKQKVLVDLACSSHNAIWEKNHTLMFRASLEWLTKTTVNGESAGMLKLGY